MKKKGSSLKNIQPEVGKKVVTSTRNNPKTILQGGHGAKPANARPKQGVDAFHSPKGKTGTPGDGLPKFPVRKEHSGPDQGLK